MLHLDVVGALGVDAVSQLVLLEAHLDIDRASRRLRLDPLPVDGVVLVVSLGDHERDVVEQGIVVGVLLALLGTLVESVHVGLVVVISACARDGSHHDLGTSRDGCRVGELGRHGHRAVVVGEGRLVIGLGLGGVLGIIFRRFGSRRIGSGGVLVGILVRLGCGGFLTVGIAYHGLAGLVLAYNGFASLGVGVGLNGSTGSTGSGILGLGLGDSLIHGLLLSGALGSGRRVIRHCRHGRGAHDHGH